MEKVRPGMTCATTRLTLIRVLVLATLSAPSFATLIPTTRIQLSRNDKSLLAPLACGRPLVTEDEFEAQRIVDDAKRTYVFVTCAAYGIVEGHPALKLANCDNLRGAWRCDSMMKAMRLAVARREIVLQYGHDVPPATAIEIANFAATVHSFNGFDIAGYISDGCAVTDSRSIPFEGAITFEFHCGLSGGTITKDCGGKQCRMFFTSFGTTML